MDTLAALAADFLASIGDRTNTALVLLCATVTFGLLISWVVLALSRRLSRIEKGLMALRQLHAEMQDNQAQVVSSLEAVAVALPDVDRFKQLLRNASGKQSELISALSKASEELESMRETVGVRLKSLQSEQDKTHKVLEAWNSRLKEMGQTVATVATLETEQAAIRNEVADWRSRFEAAYDVFAQYVRAEGQAADQVDSPPGHGQTIGSRATPVYKENR